MTDNEIKRKTSKSCQEIFALCIFLQTERQADRRTDGYTPLRRCEDASKNKFEMEMPKEKKSEKEECKKKSEQWRRDSKMEEKYERVRGNESTN